MKTKLQKAKIHDLDVEELAAHLCGLDPDESEREDIEQHFFDEYSLDLEQFADLVSVLVPLIDVGKSGLTNKQYKGFGAVDEKGRGLWLVKMEC